jgi:hypothetical protein
MREYPPIRMVKMAKMHWKAVAAGPLTCAKKCAESVLCDSSNDEKEGMTVIAPNDVAGNKCPLTVFGKGKTARCLESYCVPLTMWD